MLAWTYPKVSPDVVHTTRTLLDMREVAKRYKPEQIGALFSLASGYQQQRQYQKASDVYTALRLIKPMEPRFLIAHAVCLKMMREYEQALGTLGAAAMLEPDNPEPLMHAAECLMASDNPRAGREVLRKVLSLAAGHHKHAALAERAEGWLALSEGGPD